MHIFLESSYIVPKFTVQQILLVSVNSVKTDVTAVREKSERYSRISQSIVPVSQVHNIDEAPQNGLHFLELASTTFIQLYNPYLSILGLVQIRVTGGVSKDK